eukprot:365124-Chlamydomonas_euryale.AAC.23
MLLGGRQEREPALTVHIEVRAAQTRASWRCFCDTNAQRLDSSAFLNRLPDRAGGYAGAAAARCCSGRRANVRARAREAHSRPRVCRRARPAASCLTSC